MLITGSIRPTRKLSDCCYNATTDVTASVALLVLLWYTICGELYFSLVVVVLSGPSWLTCLLVRVLVLEEFVTPVLHTTPVHFVTTS